MYFRIFKNILFLFSIVGFSNCSDNEPDNPLCGQRAIINETLYLNANTELLDVVEISIAQDCLNIELGSSGCDGESWVVELFDAGVILESFPPQRNVVISIKNDELCDAYFTREYSFDISSLRVDGSSVFLNIANTESQILYEY